MAVIAFTALAWLLYFKDGLFVSVLSEHVLADNDDLLRLMNVRHLAEGGSWWDLVVPRLDPEHPVPLHWSRLVDAPLLALVLALEPLFGLEKAAYWVAAFWPPALLGLALAGFMVLARRLGGEAAVLPVGLLVLMAGNLLPDFSPGRVDHHNIQILLSLGLLLSVLGADGRVRLTAWSGLFTGLMLAVGYEILPVLMGVLAGFVLARSLSELPPEERAADRRAITGFALAWPATVLVALVLTQPSGHWSMPVCDALALNTLKAAVLGGGGLWLGHWLAARQQRWFGKLLGFALPGALALGLLLLSAPVCLEGPLAGIGEPVIRLWLSGVTEAQSLFSVLEERPSAAVGAYLPCLIALLGAVGLFIRALQGKADHGEHWLLLSVMAALVLLIAIVQIRVARFGILVSLPVAAGWIDSLNRGREERNALGMAAIVLLFATLPFQSLGMLLFPIPEALQALHAPDSAYRDPACQQPSSYAHAASLPQARILNSIDTGTDLLALTDHEVLSAPYHRYHRGIGAVIRLLQADPEHARALLQEEGVTAIVLCPNEGFTVTVTEDAPEGLGARLLKGEGPAWAQVVPAPEGVSLRVWRIAPTPRTE